MKLKFWKLSLIFLFINFILLYSKDSYKKGSLIFYEYNQEIKIKGEENDNSIESYFQNIFVGFDLVNSIYKIELFNSFDGGSGQVRLISQGHFKKINSTSYKMVDKNNSFILICKLKNNSIYFSVGMNELKNKIYQKVDKKTVPELIERFFYWNRDFGDNFSLNKSRKINNHIKSGIYSDKEKFLFIEIFDNNNYKLYDFDGNIIKFDISNGILEIKNGMLLFKDKDKKNIIKAYLVDDTIYPVNHFPNSFDNEPLILEKK